MSGGVNPFYIGNKAALNRLPLKEFVVLKLLEIGVKSYDFEEFPEKPNIDKTGNTDTTKEQAEFYGRMSEQIPENSRVVMVQSRRESCWLHVANMEWLSNANQEAKKAKILIFSKE